jgi:hypothetical protein
MGRSLPTPPTSAGTSNIPPARGVWPRSSPDLRWRVHVLVRRVCLGAPKADRAAEALYEEVLADDEQLFDRTVSWPTHYKRASVVATEHVVVDGPTTPDMVKAIFIAARLPGLTLKEFFDHWGTVHATLGSAVRGLRR